MKKSGTNFYVYHLVDPRSGLPFYVGKGRGKRDQSHLNSTRKRNAFKDNVIAKIRALGLEPRINRIAEGLSEADAFALEIQEIRRFGRRDIHPDGILTNLSDGGEGQSGWVVPDHIKALFSEIYSGSGNPFYGKTHSVEAREAIGQAHKGKEISASHREAISRKWKGRVLSADHIEAIRKAQTGVKRPHAAEWNRLHHKGKTISEAHRAAASAKLKGRKLSPETIAKRLATIAAKKAAISDLTNGKQTD